MPDGAHTTDLGPIDDARLKTIFEAEVKNAVGYLGGELASQRRQAQEFYQGEPYGNELDGRSQLVTRDVMDTVQWIMPALLKVFMAGDSIVEFEPVGKEDVEFARQATDYHNHVFLKENKGFMVLYEMMHDALLLKTGHVKTHWDDSDRETRETYTAQPIEQIQLLLLDPQLELLEQEERLGEGTDEVTGEPEKVYDAVFKRTTKGGRILQDALAPDEYLISRRATTADKARFQGHRSRKTISELLQMGFDKDTVLGLPTGSGQDHNAEALARLSFDDEDPGGGDDVWDKSMREVWVVDGYLWADYDGDGIAELRQIIGAGDGGSFTILHNEPVDDHPFDTICPYPIPHKFHGMSVADLMMDLQEIRSMIMRQWLDSMYLANNQRIAANENTVDLDDLLTNRPASVVRVDGPPGGEILPIPNQSLGREAFELLEYTDRMGEKRTGVTRYSAGLDAESLNDTATGIMQLKAAANQRIEMIARIFAETGVAEMFKRALRLSINHQDKPRTVKIRNEWVTISPKSWNASMDVTTQVGLGYDSKDQEALFLKDVIGMQGAAVQLQGGVSGPLVSLENVAKSHRQFTLAVGLRMADDYFLDPASDEAQEALKKLEEAAQQGDGKAQAEMAKMQAEMQLAGQRLQMETEETKRNNDLEHQARMAEIESKSAAAKIEAHLKHERELEKVRLDSQVKREVGFAQAQARKSNGSERPAA